MLFPSLEEAAPEIWDHRLELGGGEIVNSLTDDSGPGESQQFGRTGAGLAIIASVVGDQNGYGRMIDDRTEEQLEFPGTVLEQPVYGCRLCALRGHKPILGLAQNTAWRTFPAALR